MGAIAFLGFVLLVVFFVKWHNTYYPANLMPAVKIIKKEKPKQASKEKLIATLENTPSYERKLKIAKQIVSDSNATREDLEAVLIYLPLGPIPTYQRDPYKNAYERLIAMRERGIAKIRHENKNTLSFHWKLKFSFTFFKKLKPKTRETYVTERLNTPRGPHA